MKSETRIDSPTSGTKDAESELEDALKTLMDAIKVNQQNKRDGKPSQQVIKEFIESGAIK